MAILTCFFLVLIIPYAASITFDFPYINQTLQDVFTLDIGAYISDIGIQVTPENRRENPSKFVGRATYIQPLHLWDKSSRELASFDTEFSFILKSDTYNMADGLTFFLAENNTLIPIGGSLGLPVNASTGQKMAYPFVAVEFDTFGGNYWDPDESLVYEKHVGIDVNSVASVKYQDWMYNGSAGEECTAYNALFSCRMTF